MSAYDAWLSSSGNDDSTSAPSSAYDAWKAMGMPQENTAPSKDDENPYMQAYKWANSPTDIDLSDLDL